MRVQGANHCYINQLIGHICQLRCFYGQFVLVSLKNIIVYFQNFYGKDKMRVQGANHCYISQFLRLHIRRILEKLTVIESNFP